MYSNNTSFPVCSYDHKSAAPVLLKTFIISYLTKNWLNTVNPEIELSGI